MKVLMIHGNGGANTRFSMFKEIYHSDSSPIFEPYFPELPGFEGRPLHSNNPDWEPFISTLQNIIKPFASDDWVLYGHGIGGSMLLEWANIGFTLDGVNPWKPFAVLLHAPVGASLSKRWFPKIMKFKPIRFFLHWLIYQKSMQPIWERRLFLEPENIPINIRNQFFEDYKNCEAFPIFFDLIQPEWYEKVKHKTSDQPFHFLWGRKERVIKSRFLDFWKADFPLGMFTIIDNWDHFPMLDDVADFYTFFKQYIAQLKS